MLFVYKVAVSLLLGALTLDVCYCLYEREWQVQWDIENPDGYMREVIAVYDTEEIAAFTDDVDETFPVNMSCFPGPEVRVKQGELVRITVVNKFDDVETSIHWHGLKMLHQNWMDGVAGVTQCAIPPDRSFTYEFTVDNGPGTYFYHSHSSIQYGDGLTGAFIVEADTLEEDTIWQAHNYSRDHVMMLQDWAHENYHAKMYKYQARYGSTPGFVPDYPLWPVRSVLINGVGQFSCGTEKFEEGVVWIDEKECESIRVNGWGWWQYNETAAPMPEGHGFTGQCHPERSPYMGECTPGGIKDPPVFECPVGETIRIRLIQSAAGMPMGYWIDRHTSLVVARDGHDTVPFGPNVGVLVAIGQRLDLIVVCDQDPGFDYPIYAGYSDAYYPGSYKKMPNKRDGVVYATALLRYTGVGAGANSARAPAITPLDMLTYRNHLQSLGASTEFLPLFEFKLTAADPQLATAPVASERIQIDVKGHGNWPGYTPAGVSLDGKALEWWTINDRLFAMPNTPLVFVEHLGLSPLSTELYEGRDEDSLPTFFQLEYRPEDPLTYEIVLVNYEAQQHPWHVHGYSVQMLGAGFFDREAKWRGGTYNISRTEVDEEGNWHYTPSLYGFAELNETAQNVAVGDSFTVPPRGFVVLRLTADNPGAWAFHCHMEHHLHAGMLTVLSVAYPDGSYRLETPPESYKTCGYRADTCLTGSSISDGVGGDDDGTWGSESAALWGTVVAAAVVLLGLSFAVGHRLGHSKGLEGRSLLLPRTRTNFSAST